MGVGTDNLDAGTARLWDAIKGTPKAAWNEVKGMRSKTAAELPAMTEIKTPFLFKFVTVPANWAFQIIKYPFSKAAAYTGLGLDKLGDVYRSKPLLMGAATVAAAGYGINRYLRGSAEERTARDLQNEVAKLNTIQAQNAALPAPVANTYNYHNSVTPQESAAMEARLQERAANGSQVDALANRQAASEVAPAAL